MSNGHTMEVFLSRRKVIGQITGTAPAFSIPRIFVSLGRDKAGVWVRVTEKIRDALMWQLKIDQSQCQKAIVEDVLKPGWSEPPDPGGSSDYPEDYVFDAATDDSA